MGMEYVKKTHEIWIIGGDQYSNYPKKEASSLCFYCDH